MPKKPLFSLAWNHKTKAQTLDLNLMAQKYNNQVINNFFIVCKRLLQIFT